VTNTKLLAFVITLAIFIPLIAVPEIEENPFSHPQQYEEYTTPIKDYDIVSELKDLEKEGVATAVFQPEIDGMEQADDDKDPEGSQENEIKDLSGLLEFKPELSDWELRDFLEHKLIMFDEADLHPSYFIIPDVKYRFRVTSILDEIVNEMELPRIQLMVKDDESEISTETLVYLDREASNKAVEPINTPEGESERVEHFGALVMDYLEKYAPGSKILTIDSQDWNPGVALVLNRFVNVIDNNDIDIVIRIENISKETSAVVFNEIITFCQNTAEATEPAGSESAPGTRGGSDAREIEGNSGGHVQEIILGAMPETSDLKTVSDGRFAIILEVINGFYYIILLTCVLPNLYFVAWAGFIRRRNARAKKFGMQEKLDRKESGFNKRLQYLEKQLGRAILFNNEIKGRGQEQRFGDNGPTGRPMRAAKDKKWPDVTIIVPCFNEQKGIAMAVERCFNQTYKGRVKGLYTQDRQDLRGAVPEQDRACVPQGEWR
jgi:hypothetical protein